MTALQDALDYCVNVMELPPEVAARRAALMSASDRGFPLDVVAWHDNLDLAKPLLREALMESLGVEGEPLKTAERDALTEALIETLGEVGADIPLAENELCDMATSQRAVGMARSMWLHGGCPSRLIGLIAARAGDQSLISLWRNAVEHEDYRVRVAQEEMEKWIAECEENE